MKKKTVYYKSEEDEFSRARITPRVIDKSYRYLPTSSAERIFSASLYRCVATPLAYTYVKARFSRRIIGKDKLLPYAKCGYFLYGNHTHAIFDALNPGTLVFPKRAYTVASAENLSIKGLGIGAKHLGAIPIPDTALAYRAFKDAIRQRIDEGACIVIYPEAHIWPYHTGIRSFPETSFYLPASLNTPVFCFTNTYHKGGALGVRVITYIDGPFFPDGALDKRKNAALLADSVRRAMIERAKSSTLTLVEYKMREGCE